LVMFVLVLGCRAMPGRSNEEIVSDIAEVQATLSQGDKSIENVLQSLKAGTLSVAAAKIEISGLQDAKYKAQSELSRLENEQQGNTGGGGIWISLLYSLGGVALGGASLYFPFARPAMMVIKSLIRGVEASKSDRVKTIIQQRAIVDGAERKLNSFVKKFISE